MGEVVSTDFVTEFKWLISIDLQISTNKYYVKLVKIAETLTPPSRKWSETTWSSNIQPCTTSYKQLDNRLLTEMISSFVKNK